jgi:hypothetical protein
MQRRAVAGYAGLFLLLAVGAYAMLAVTPAPVIAFDDPAHDVSMGEELTVDGRTYTVATIESTGGGGGHGGGGGGSLAATLEWTNESARYTESWAAGDELETEVDGTTYTVVRLANDTEPRAVELREPLTDDVTTKEVNGTTYVVQGDAGDPTLTPLSEYDGVDRRRIEVGETFDYGENRATLEAVAGDSARVAWTAPRTTEVEATQHANVTLNGRQFVAHFPNNESLQLVADYGEFQSQEATVHGYETRANGFKGITILGAVTAVLLFGLAYLPTRR